MLSTISRAYQELKNPKLEYEFVRVMKTWSGVFPDSIVSDLERKYRKTSSSSKRSSLGPCPLSPTLVVALSDLRSAVSQPAHLYRADLVASIFAHVQINSNVLKRSTGEGGRLSYRCLDRHCYHFIVFSIDTNAFC